ncbi:glycosyltransferase [Pseudoclavibacter helvolus]|uniref:glycosyltransferase n=1 Tax=Pseudoclavibacter helvolus TaxID=255205 RepID=UPI00161306D5|nr:glycosyltransferase [Pseudoclavibacter helvolus]
MAESRSARARAETRQRPRVAIAHDYITQRGGAERLLLSMHHAFPDARIYTTLYEPDATYPEFKDLDIVVSPINRFSAFRRDHRKALPFLAPASSGIHIDADVVLASTTGWAHGFKTNGQMIAYCNTPARFLYLPEQYLGDAGPLSLRALGLRFLSPFLRAWDQRAAKRVETYVSNSSAIRERVRTVYGRESEVVYPAQSVNINGPRVPAVGLEDFVGDGGHLLLVSRLMPYKNVDKAIAAVASLPNERLVIVGDGPQRADLVASLPDNVRLVSGISDEELRWLYARSRALVAPSFEDFGLTVVEAAAWGKPSIALRAGGYLDTVAEGVTGRFFDAADAKSIAAAIAASRFDVWDVTRIKEHAREFSEEAFARKLQKLVDETLARAGA